MKRLLSFLLTVTLATGFGACGNTSGTVSLNAPTSVPATQAVPSTAETTSVPAQTEPVPRETEPVPTEPEHSPYYLPDVSLEDMITYFNEVVLSTEYSTGDGDTTLVQKWTAPIRYRITGDATEEDLEVLDDLFRRLNEIEGFPGIYPADETMPVEDLTISFLDENTFNIAFSDFLQGEYADGAVQYWYYDDNAIYSGRIGYRTDLTQELRNSVLPEEMVNLLGITDTTMREDSIVYQYSSDATELSAVDWALIGLLYHPDIQCGMNAEQCREVLETLYY